MFSALKVAPDATSAQPIERQIWAIWLESGNREIDELMRQGSLALAAQNYDLALTAFDHVVRKAPAFAEGWNKRATVLWLMDRNEESLVDVERTLALEPRHFGALSGRGMIEIELGRDAEALQALEEALGVHPQLHSVKEMARELQEKVQGKPI